MMHWIKANAPIGQATQASHASHASHARPHEEVMIPSDLFEHLQGKLILGIVDNQRASAHLSAHAEEIGALVHALIRGLISSIPK